MKNDCQAEDELLRIHSYDELPQALRFALDRCTDRVKNGETLPREEIRQFDIYAYRIGDKISRGINNETLGVNIFREQLQTGNERKHPMPKRLKLKDWQDQARQANPEMFDPPPLKIVEPVKSPLAQPQQKLTTEEKKTAWQKALGWFR